MLREHYLLDFILQLSHDMKKIKLLTCLCFIVFVPFLLSSQEIEITPDTVDVLTYKLNGRTATGARTTKIKGKFVAISRDLLDKYPLRSKIRLSDCRWEGVYRVMDIMGRRHSKTVDVFYKGARRNRETCICSKVE